MLIKLNNRCHLAWFPTWNLHNPLSRWVNRQLRWACTRRSGGSSGRENLRTFLSYSASDWSFKFRNDGETDWNFKFHLRWHSIVIIRRDWGTLSKGKYWDFDDELWTKRAEERKLIKGKVLFTRVDRGRPSREVDEMMKFSSPFSRFSTWATSFAKVAITPSTRLTSDEDGEENHTENKTEKKVAACHEKSH